MITATRHPFVIARTFTKEESSAVSTLEIVPSADGNDSYDVMISYRTSDNVYRLKFDVKNLDFMPTHGNFILRKTEG